MTAQTKGVPGIVSLREVKGEVDHQREQSRDQRKPKGDSLETVAGLAWVREERTSLRKDNWLARFRA